MVSDVILDNDRYNVLEVKNSMFLLITVPFFVMQSTN